MASEAGIERDVPEWRDPWVVEGATVYDWIAARPELYSATHLAVRPESYDPYRTLPARPGVYYLMNDAGGANYIGKASNLSRRVFAHWQKGRVPFSHVWWIEIPHDANEVVEALMIDINDPPYNRKFCPRMEEMSDRLRAAIKRHEAASDALLQPATF